MKIIMTSAASDPQEFQRHTTTSSEKKMLAKRMKNVSDKLKIVIVCDMWLTGFDVPCLHTMYIDKPMSGYNLMQAREISLHIGLQKTPASQKTF